MAGMYQATMAKAKPKAKGKPKAKSMRICRGIGGKPVVKPKVLRMLRLGWFVTRRFRHGESSLQVANYLVQQTAKLRGYWLERLLVAPAKFMTEVVEYYKMLKQ